MAIRPPTLRTLGIAGALVGAVALAAPFAWKWFWPAPFATIRLPDAYASAGDCFVARGDVAPSTIWQPLWLIEAGDGRPWRPVDRIDPSPGTWQRRICVEGLRRDRFSLALVVADGDCDLEFRRALESPDEEEIPEWLKPGRKMEQGGRGRRLGLRPIPRGAKLVASVAVTVVDGGELFGGWMGSCDDECRNDWLMALEAYEGERRRRHDERRVLRSHGLQSAVVRGVPD